MSNASNHYTRNYTSINIVFAIKSPKIYIVLWKCFPAECWTETSDSYAPDEIVQLSARTLLECQNQCLSSLTTSCAFGFDWNPSNEVGNQCFFSTSPYVFDWNLPRCFSLPVYLSKW